MHLHRLAVVALCLTTLWAHAEAPKTPKGPFEVKSGIVEMTTDMMGEQKSTLYFDDYGQKQALYTKTSVTMFGTTVTSSNADITADGKVVRIDFEKKTGTRSAAAAPSSTVPDPATLTKELKARYNFQELPDKEIAGKTCKGFAMEPMKGMPMKAWTWKGVPMLTMTRVGNGLVTMTTTSFQETAAPADKFKVPADIKLTEN